MTARDDSSVVVSRYRAIAALLASLLVPLATTACQDEGTIRVRSITFTGVHAIPASRLKQALATRESSKFPWVKSRTFVRARFEEDVARIRAFYTDRGYPNARVTNFDIKLNRPQDAVDISLTIDEGEALRVAALDFEGFDVIPAAHLDVMRARVPLKVGEPRDRELSQVTRELAVNELRDHGFPYARVSLDETSGPTATEVRLVLKAEPGKMAVFGPVTVAGNKSVGEDVIRRELAYAPGELYRRSLVQDTQRRLYGLELFQFATVSPVNPEAVTEEIPTKITVAESKHQRVKFGGGYGTEENARVDAEYHHLNFFGGARSAGVHARWSGLDRGVRFDFTQPYVFVPHFSLSAAGQRWYTVTPAYESVVSGGKLVVRHRANPKMTWAVSLTREHESSAIADSVLDDPTLRNSLIALGLDPRTNIQSGDTAAVGLSFERSTVDNPLDGHRGLQLGVQAEQAGAWLGGTFKYTMVTTDVRHYTPLGDRLTLATRLQTGNVAPTGAGEASIPFSKKYFLGGATSVRGWGRYEISPLVSGLPVGGNSMLAVSAEVRAPLTPKLGTVVFLDGGNVWAAAGGIRLDDLRYAVGTGLRYQTPVGPFRFDFGYQLNPIPNLIVDGEPEARRWRIHVSIGQAF